VFSHRPSSLYAVTVRAASCEGTLLPAVLADVRRMPSTGRGSNTGDHVRNWRKPLPDQRRHNKGRAGMLPPGLSPPLGL